MPKPIGRLHVLTDFHFQQRYSHAEIARMAIAGGADTVQFRQKHGGIRDLLHEAQQTALACQEHSIPLIVDDRIDVALACDAAGIHLGQTDFPVAEARRILGSDKIIGATATTLDQALRAQDDGADYIGFGPVFETASKANPASVKGLRALAAVSRGVTIPVIAIAGIRVDRVASVIQSGAHGIAVMTAVTTAADPVGATQQIRHALDEAIAETLIEGSSGDGVSNS